MDCDSGPYSGANMTLPAPMPPAAFANLSAPTPDFNVSGIDWYINMIAVPSIVVIGIAGNTLSFVVFVTTHLKYKSSSIYLASLNVVDTGFLFSLLPMWLGWLHVDVFHREGWCQITVYATYVFSFMSVWTVVAFTIERFVVVFYPLKKQVICTTKRALGIIGAIVAIGLVLYAYSLFTTGIHVDCDGYQTCAPRSEMNDVLAMLSTVDTFITYLVPSVLIIFLNSSIAVKLIIYYRLQQHTQQHTRSNGHHHHGHHHHGGVGGGGGGGGPGGVGSHHQHSSFSTKPSKNNNNTSSSGGGGSDASPMVVVNNSSSGPPATRAHHIFTSSQPPPPAAATTGAEDGDESCRRLYVEMYTATPGTQNPLKLRAFSGLTSSTIQAQRQRSFQNRTTRTLLTISTIFVLLNLPSHAFRVYSVAMALAQQDYVLSDTMFIAQEICNVLYYANFAANLFLYTLCSRSFRRAHLKLWQRVKRKLACVVLAVGNLLVP